MKNTVLNRAFKASPDYNAHVQGSIGTSGASASEADTDLKVVIAGWNGGSDFRTYETNYPSFDESNKQVSLRIFVSATQANGNTIREYGDFNDDGTERLGGRFTFDGIAKTSGIQIFFTPKYEVE